MTSATVEPAPQASTAVRSPTLRDFTAGDWIGVVLAAAPVVSLIAFPFTIGPVYRRMYRDFGGALPPLTELVLSRWFTWVIVAPSALCLFVALRAPLRLGFRRLWVVLALVAAAVATAVTLAGTSMPIYWLDGVIQ